MPSLSLLRYLLCMRCAAPHRLTKRKRQGPKSDSKNGKASKKVKQVNPSIYYSNEDPIFENVEMVAGSQPSRSDYNSVDTTDCDESYDTYSYDTSARSCSSYDTLSSQNRSEESFEEMINRYYDVYGADAMSDLDVSPDAEDWGYFVDYNDP